MSDLERLREFLTIAADDPPGRVSVRAVRRQAMRRWAIEYGAAAVVIALLAGVVGGRFRPGNQPRSRERRGSA